MILQSADFESAVSTISPLRHFNYLEAIFTFSSILDKEWLKSVIELCVNIENIPVSVNILLPILLGCAD